MWIASSQADPQMQKYHQKAIQIQIFIPPTSKLFSASKSFGYWKVKRLYLYKRHLTLSVLSFWCFLGLGGIDSHLNKIQSMNAHISKFGKSVDQQKIWSDVNTLPKS